MPATKPTGIGLAAESLRGLHRKRDLTLDEVLQLSPGGYRFLLSGPYAKTNKAAIDKALAERAAARKVK